MGTIKPVRVPKWGFSMEEGTVTRWWKEEGAQLAAGEELVDIETSKITNSYESPVAGTLRRIVAQAGDTLPVGALLAVVVEGEVADEKVEAFIADFRARFVPGEEVSADAGTELLTVSTDAGDIRVARLGSAAQCPVVLIHGYAGDLNSWANNIETLAARGPVIAFDLPGHGGSTKDVGDGSIGSLATPLAQALAKLGVTKAHLIGHSLGAAAALRIAAQQPALAASLTLICPALVPGTQVSAQFLRGIIDARRTRELRPVMEMLFDNPSTVTKGMLEDMLKYKYLDGVDVALTRVADRLSSAADAAEVHSALSRVSPLTLVTTRGDRIAGCPDLAALPPGARVVQIDAGGHMPHLERADEVNRILLEATR